MKHTSFYAIKTSETGTRIRVVSSQSGVDGDCASVLVGLAISLIYALAASLTLVLAIAFAHAEREDDLYLSSVLQNLD